VSVSEGSAVDMVWKGHAPAYPAGGAPQIEETEVMKRLDQLEGVNFVGWYPNFRFPPIRNNQLGWSFTSA
jgi:hypothetical protein